LLRYLLASAGMTFPFGETLPTFEDLLRVSKIRANANPRVARTVVVAVAVVVDISEIRRRHDIPQPPVRTIKGHPEL